MRKRILAMLLLCLCFLGLTACGEDPKTMDYNGKSYAELQETSVGYWESLREIDMAQIEQLVTEINAYSEAEQVALFEANEGLKEQVALFESWMDVSEQAGEYIGVKDFSVTKTGKSTTAELTLDFENRPVIFTMVYSNRDMSTEDMTVDLVYTTAEKMQKAGLNTLMGMGTVFAVLIIICLIISCFSLINKAERRLKGGSEEKKEAPRTAPARATAAPAPAAAPAPTADSLELVAVIAAAIAAHTGQSTDDFVVRSIKRR